MIINAVSIPFGGIFDALTDYKLSAKLKAEITLVFGVCSMGIGISTIGLMRYMLAVIFTLVMGTGIGLTSHLGEALSKGAMLIQKPISRLIKNQRTELSEEGFMEALVAIIVLSCASGASIYGSLGAGITRNGTVLISKSILNFFMAAVSTRNLGYVVSMVAVSQFITFFILFLLAKIIFPTAAPDMTLDFKACGEFLTLATGSRVVKLKEFPTVGMVPAVILVTPFSWIWVSYIMTWV